MPYCLSFFGVAWQSMRQQCASIFEICWVAFFIKDTSCVVSFLGFRSVAVRTWWRTLFICCFVHLSTGKTAIAFFLAVLPSSKMDWEPQCLAISDFCLFWLFDNFGSYVSDLWLSFKSFILSKRDVASAYILFEFLLASCKGDGTRFIQNTQLFLAALRCALFFLDFSSVAVCVWWRASFDCWCIHLRIGRNVAFFPTIEPSVKMPCKTPCLSVSACGMLNCLATSVISISDRENHHKYFIPNQRKIEPASPKLSW